MKPEHLSILLILLLSTQFFVDVRLSNKVVAQISAPDIFVGVDVAYNNVTAIMELADQISNYSNFFIIGNTGITQGYSSGNSTARENYRIQLTNLSQYLYDKGFYFMYYGDMYPSNISVDIARKWGDRFLGYYAYDEEGGKQLDRVSDPHHNLMYISSAINNSDASNKFVNTLNSYLRIYPPYGFTRNFASPTEFSLFTSDYALYWFDYKGGYDGIFAEFGLNYSKQLNIALCRGAATAQNKEWGVMITHKYTEPPYIESGPELFEDMKYAYNNGAKYLVVFDSNKNWTEGTLEQDHFDAMKQFWQYAQNHPRIAGPVNERTAYVLPADFAYGFRGPEDKIWGLWEANSTSLSLLLSVSVNIMLERYGQKLDIIYEDAMKLGNVYGYNNIVYWNDPAAVKDVWPSWLPYPTPNVSSPANSSELPTSTDTTPLTQSPTLPASPSASSLENATPEQSLSPSLPLTTQPSLTSEPGNSFALPFNYGFGALIAAFLIAIITLVFLFRKKQRFASK